MVSFSGISCVSIRDSKGTPQTWLSFARKVTGILVNRTLKQNVVNVYLKVVEMRGPSNHF